MVILLVHIGWLPVRLNGALASCKGKSGAVRDENENSEVDVGIRKFFKKTEKLIRSRRIALTKCIFSNRRARKIILDSLPSNVVSMTVKFDDHSISFDPKDMIGRYIFSTGNFDRYRVEYVCSLLAEEGLITYGEKIVIDIGANIGTQTIYFMKTGLFRRAIAIEPDPGNFVFLKRNVEDNYLNDVVEIVPVAVGATNGQMQLYCVPGNSGESSLLKPAGVAGVSVEVRTVTDVLSGLGVDISEIGCVWMDVEGYEPNVCQGMQPLLDAGVPMVIEFSPELYGHEESRSFLSMLAKHYTVAIIFEGIRKHSTTPELVPLDQGQLDVLFLRKYETSLHRILE
jgi:FkbM family methyltransferase